MNIGFISTRFAGTDGVSLEAAKWGKVFEEMGHSCYWFSGQTDLADDIVYCHPPSFFGHETVTALQKDVFGRSTRTREISTKIRRLTEEIKDHLYAFIDKFSLDLIIPQNALTIPMHIPLGLAITECICETGINCIAHHHDFFWERQRFATNAVSDYLSAAFPAPLSTIQHVCINSIAAQQLAHRTGLSSEVVPNVIDFEAPYAPDEGYTEGLRHEIGVGEDEYLILQPARIVPRKGIEHAIELVRRLNSTSLEKKSVLVFSHSAGDEGMEYFDYLKDKARNDSVRIVDFSTQVDEHRLTKRTGEKIYTLQDIYSVADFVTYPSLYEGFGNAFLETLYFRKPVLVNRYSVYAADIEPLGFDCVMMDQYLTDEAVRKVAHILTNESLCKEITDRNFEIAKKHFSYNCLRKKLKKLLSSFE